MGRNVKLLRHISTHDLIQRSTIKSSRFAIKIIFQLTTSYRGRRTLMQLLENCRRISTHDLIQRSTVIGLVKNATAVPFQLTTSYRGRLLLIIYYISHFVFQLTTSYRGRPRKAREVCWTSSYFNSRPHTEVDDVG